VQGQMVDAGMKLYRLADLGIVWVFAQVYEQDLPYVHKTLLQSQIYGNPDACL